MRRKSRESRMRSLYDNVLNGSCHVSEAVENAQGARHWTVMPREPESEHDGDREKGYMYLCCYRRTGP